MYLLYCDETNLEERAGDFLIYGGLMIGADQVLNLSLSLDALRHEHDVPPEYSLKFNPGPEALSHDQFLSFKQASLECAIAHGAQLLVYVVLHDISRGPDIARRNGINTLCYHFHCVLNRVGGPGLVLIDRFTDEGNRIDAHLREKFSTGIVGLPGQHDAHRLDNIVGLHYSAIGQSHLPSLIDVAVGSLRFAINAHTRNQERNLGTANLLLRLLSPMFWRREEGAPIPDLGFTFSPMTVRVARYREKYEALKRFLAEAGVHTGQMIHAERPY